MADMKFQLRLKDELVTKLQADIAKIRQEHEQKKTGLNKDYENQKEQLEKYKEMIKQATIQMEAQRNCIITLRREQRMMTGMVHSFGRDVHMT